MKNLDAKKAPPITSQVRAKAFFTHPFAPERFIMRYTEAPTMEMVGDRKERVLGVGQGRDSTVEVCIRLV